MTLRQSVNTSWNSGATIFKALVAGYTGIEYERWAETGYERDGWDECCMFCCCYHWPTTFVCRGNIYVKIALAFESLVRLTRQFAGGVR